MVAAVGVASLCVAPAKSEAGIFFRPIAPVRRVAARTVLPPYPVARTVVAPVYGPAYRPVYGPAYGAAYAPVYGPALYGAPYGVGYGGVSITLGY
jgi:hypothetical protein